MPAAASPPTDVFPTLLRYWRNTRGLSQQALAESADISAKHISFLETGRAKPSQPMVLRLGATLDLSLRDQNALLQTAGFSGAFAETETAALDPAIQHALKMMMDHHEPFPLLVFDGAFDLVQANGAATRLLELLLGPSVATERNILKMVFDPALLRPHIVEWEGVAQMLLIRLQRDALHRRRDTKLSQLMSTLCAFPGVPKEWRTPNLQGPATPTFSVQFEHAGQRFSFLTTLTVFQAPQDISLEELHIESYFPLDEQTGNLCKALAY